ncbi:conserved hypothetical protein [Candidatus Koribacter versatilis Ellin345]|uniref:DUF3052 domain-containing protein n=1 Tax=Koribacter versatilis (strain Ellin345) TaxID=204669 RepID=Q1IV82_KORVE|nr:DUF3052 family protein [Candidatus Koribacter versatilis]ABF39218.1 conserved hypothetical protein [Candidatus Koribacter versatilis Ellin345]
MAGYSGTPLVQKLGIKPGHRIATVSEPPSFDKALGALPEGAAFVGSTAKNVDVVVAFETDAKQFQKHLPGLASRIKQDGMIWIAWPKKASGVQTDLTEDPIRNFALKLGLVDIKVCAIDETWSGLKLVIRKENRAKAAKK